DRRPHATQTSDADAHFAPPEMGSDPLPRRGDRLQRSGKGSDPTPQATIPAMLFKLRIHAADLATGRAAAGIIGELVAPEPLAVTLFEDKPPAFVVEAYWDAEPALALIVDALAGLAANLGAPSLEA